MFFTAAERVSLMPPRLEEELAALELARESRVMTRLEAGSREMSGVRMKNISEFNN